MARNHRKDLEPGLHGANNISGAPLWRTRAITLLIRVANQTQAQAVSLQMRSHVLSEASPLLIGVQRMKTASIKRKAKWRPFNSVPKEVNRHEATLDIRV